MTRYKRLHIKDVAYLCMANSAELEQWSYLYRSLWWKGLGFININMILTRVKIPQVRSDRQLSWMLMAGKKIWGACNGLKNPQFLKQVPNEYYKREYFRR